MEDEEEEDVISVSDPENLKPPSVPTKKRKTDDEILVLSDYLCDPEWKAYLKAEIEKPYFERLCKFLYREITELRMTVYPPLEDVFNVFNMCPLSKIKVVIIGQDPYIGPNQAMGVSFSVRKGVKIPPSLENVFQEVQTDVGKCKNAEHGDLSKWVKQGVFMLNSVLTVRKGDSNSHQGKGWEEFTTYVVRKISEVRPFIVVMVWGKYAQEKARVVDRSKHCILSSAHPSPLSCVKFFKNKHFSICNKKLKEKGIPEIDWDIE